MDSWALVFGQIFRQLVSSRAKTLRNTTLVALRHTLMKNASLPVDVGCAKTTLFKLSCDTG